MLKAERRLIEGIVGRLKDNPSLAAWDNSNEVDNLRPPRNHEVARRWMEEIYRAIRRIDLEHPITLGIHQEDLEYDKGFRVQEITAYVDFPRMHGYSIFSPWGRIP
ncbi:MAG: hypothetical protein B6U69_00015 [Thermofilum sp. ex4484_15]|nr:MAG: hypothetical protein B6U69_00015 [Thermofilum sp. ex4484_15]